MPCCPPEGLASQLAADSVAASLLIVQYACVCMHGRFRVQGIGPGVHFVLEKGKLTETLCGHSISMLKLFLNPVAHTIPNKEQLPPRVERQQVRVCASCTQPLAKFVVLLLLCVSAFRNPSLCLWTYFCLEYG